MTESCDIPPVTVAIVCISLFVWVVVFSLAALGARQVRDDLAAREAVPPRSLNLGPLLMQYMRLTSTGKVFDILIGGLSVLSTALFVYDTYNEDVTLVFQLEIIIANFFMVNWIMYLFSVPNKWDYFFSGESLIDLSTCLPVLVGICASDYIEKGGLRTGRVWRLPRMLRVFRLIRPINTIAKDFFVNPIRGHIFKAICWCAIFLVVVSGLVQVNAAYDWEHGHYWEGDLNRLQLHDAIYYTIVTISTVGYGDISPPTLPSRMLVALLLLTFMVMIPLRISEFSELFKLYTRNAANAVRTKFASRTVVIFCEGSAHASVASMVHEIYHEDRGISAQHVQHVVVMITCEPDQLEWQNLNMKYQNVTILKGNALQRADLERAGAAKAVGFFILADPFTDDVAREESTVLRRALSVRNFVEYERNTSAAIYVQVISESAWERLVQLGFDGSNVTCFETLRRCLLLSTCVCPGISSIIQNALTSNSLRDVYPSLRALKPPIPEWYHEYARSMTYELYKLPIGHVFSGFFLKDVIRWLYLEYGVTCLSIGEKLAKNDEDPLHRGTNDDQLVRPTFASVGSAQDADAYIFTSQTMVPPASVHEGSSVVEMTDHSGSRPKRSASRDVRPTFVQVGAAGRDRGCSSDSTQRSWDSTLSGISKRMTKATGLFFPGRRTEDSDVLREPSLRRGIVHEAECDGTSTGGRNSFLCVTNRDNEGRVLANQHALIMAPNATVCIQVCRAGPQGLQAWLDARAAVDQVLPDEDQAFLHTHSMPSFREVGMSAELHKMANGHIVIVCESMTGVNFVVRVLRSSDQMSRPIVILCSFHAENAAADEAAVDELLAMLEVIQFSECYVLRGLNPANFKAAQMHLAHTVILLSGQGKSRAAHHGLSVAQTRDDNMMSICVEVLRYVDIDRTRVIVELNENEGVYQFEIIKSYNEPTGIPTADADQFSRVLGSLGGMSTRNNIKSRRSPLVPRSASIELPRLPSRPRPSVLPLASLPPAPCLESVQHPQRKSMFFEGELPNHLMDGPMQAALLRSSISFNDLSANGVKSALSELWGPDAHRQDTNTTGVNSVPPLEDHRLQASYVAGNAVLSTFSESFLASLYFTPELSGLVTAIFGAIDQDIQSSGTPAISVVTVGHLLDHVVDIMSTRPTYGHVFDKLLDNDIVCFGIYRKCSGLKDKRLAYYSSVSPPHSTKLNRADSLYIMFNSNGMQPRIPEAEPIDFKIEECQLRRRAKQLQEEYKLKASSAGNQSSNDGANSTSIGGGGDFGAEQPPSCVANKRRPLTRPGITADSEPAPAPAEIPGHARAKPPGSPARRRVRLAVTSLKEERSSSTGGVEDSTSRPRAPSLSVNPEREAKEEDQEDGKLVRAHRGDGWGSESRAGTLVAFSDEESKQGREDARRASHRASLL